MGLRAELLEQMTDDSRIDAIPAEAFKALANLLALVANPKATAETLADLEKRLTDARKQEHRAQTIIDRHNLAMAKDRDELNERREQLAAKSRELTGRESMVAERERALERAKVTHHDGTTFGSLVREREVRDGQTG
jgi:hypothetical protein